MKLYFPTDEITVVSIWKTWFGRPMAHMRHFKGEPSVSTRDYTLLLNLYLCHRTGLRCLVPSRTRALRNPLDTDVTP